VSYPPISTSGAAVTRRAASFLWHIPISDEERAYKHQHGADALIDRLEPVELPWLSDKNNRPPLVE
jgi:hypothetical protein